jgi:catechol 2,3-dioxygenase-like lactoylglutathione lyase family enzyme
MAKFCFVIVHVNDIAKAKDFYINVLGFEDRNVPAGPGVAPLVGEGISPVLVEVAKANESSYPDSSQIIVGIETDDIVKSFGEYQAKGVSFFEEAPEPFPAGQVARFRDPAGNVLELIQWG